MENKKAALLLFICIFLYTSFFSEVQAASTAPVIDRIELSLGRVGQDFRIYGKNLFSSTRVEFTGGAVATEVIVYDSSTSIERETVDPNVAVRIPAGAKTGRIKVCNGNLCTESKESFTVLASLRADSSISFVGSVKSKTYRVGDEVHVKYKTVNQPLGENVRVYVEKRDKKTYDPNNPKTARSLFVGETNSQSDFSFKITDYFVEHFGVGNKSFFIKLCTAWCERTSVSKNGFSVKKGVPSKMVPPKKREPESASCKITTDKTTYRQGDTVVLTWKSSSNVVRATWGGFAGSSRTVYPTTAPVGLSGSQTVLVDSVGEKSVTLQVSGREGVYGDVCTASFTVVAK